MVKKANSDPLILPIVMLQCSNSGDTMNKITYCYTVILEGSFKIGCFKEIYQPLNLGKRLSLHTNLKPIMLKHNFLK